MTSLKDRQRAAARAKLEREMALRQEQVSKRRHRRTWSAAIALSAVVLIVAIVLIVNASGGSKAKPNAAASAGPASATCVWMPNPNPSASPSPAASAPVNKDLIKTGTPPTTGIPNKGTKTMTLTTSNLGTITVSLDLAKAPCAAESLTYLSGKNFYNKTGCDNLITQGPYLLMCGDPSNKGDGGPDYTYATENLPTTQRPNYQQGDVVMLNNGAGDGSQFMFITKDTPVQTDPSTGAESSLIPSNYTIVGTVTGGMDIVNKVAAAGAQATNKLGAAMPKIPVTFTSVTVGPAS